MPAELALTSKGDQLALKVFRLKPKGAAGAGCPLGARTRSLKYPQAGRARSCRFLFWTPSTLSQESVGNSRGSSPSLSASIEYESR